MGGDGLLWSKINITCNGLGPENSYILFQWVRRFSCPMSWDTRVVPKVGTGLRTGKLLWHISMGAQYL